MFLAKGALCDFNKVGLQKTSLKKCHGNFKYLRIWPSASSFHTGYSLFKITLCVYIFQSVNMQGLNIRNLKLVFCNGVVQNKVFSFFRSSRLDVFCKKGVLKNFAKLTGKHMCPGLFFKERGQWCAQAWSSGAVKPLIYQQWQF